MQKMDSCGTTSKERGTTDFRCVQCGFPMKTLYIQYSPGNIRLMKCGNCKAVADEYIECEVMILIIDLILHKPKAYRHLFYNMFSKETVNFESVLWKSVLAYLLLDIYRMWVLRTNEKEWPSRASVASLLLEFGKMLAGVILGNLIFLCVVFQATRKFLRASTGFYGCFMHSVAFISRIGRDLLKAASFDLKTFATRITHQLVNIHVFSSVTWWKQIVLVVLVSSYFKIFLMAMMVWEFPSSVIFIIDIFVISSNIVALKVITNSVMMRCLAVCAIAHGLKFLASQNKAFVLQN